MEKNNSLGVDKTTSYSVKTTYREANCEVIEISVSTLKLYIGDFVKSIHKRGEVWSPIGLAVSLILTLVTCDFKDFTIVSGVEIRVFVATFFVFVLCYTVKNIYNNCKHKAETLDNLINKLKDACVSQTKQQRK